MKGRMLLVGGLSSLHDALCAAALRAVGFEAATLHRCTDSGLRRARALGNHGQCNPAHYSVGAVLKHADASGLAPADFADRHAWLTLGSNGPCRLAAFGFEYRRVLTGAGLGALPLLSVGQLAFVGHLTDSVLEPAAANAVLRAVITGDVLAALGHQLRPWVSEPAALDALLEGARDGLVTTLEGGVDPGEGLAAAGERARALPASLERVLPRVVLVGEPWTTVTDGDPSYDLARRLEVEGAQLDCPTATDWLRQLLWEKRTGASSDEARDVFSGADRRVVELWGRLAAAAGVTAPLADPDELALLAAPHYSPDVRGGSGHLEVGRALKAARDRSAHLVLSLKPFGCLPSSALSDGVLAPLLVARGGPAFLAIETTGDARGTVDSRVEMALHAATLRASDELEEACGLAGLTRGAAEALLRRTPPQRLSDSSPRLFACAAAELIARTIDRDAPAASI